MSSAKAADRFDGTYFRGEGDVEYLQLLDTAYRMLYPDPELQNIAMLYNPAWNGFVEGPTWNMWWIQNSYGTTYCALPFFLEPYTTFLQNAQDLWFDQMGDGKTVRSHIHHDKEKTRFNWVPPDGCLCDAASPGRFVAKQGDGRIDINDWGMEFTAAGLLMQAELLLISRDQERINHYLPRLERCANFIETRRDPKNNLFLAGPAGNLLAPSYAGYKKPDGTYGMAYLTGLSVTYIAALDRLIELEKMANGKESPVDKVALYMQRRDLARKGLAAVTEEEGYLIRSLDPDGVRHGVYGAKKHGYFEASPNHDAIAFRVMDDEQSRKIYNKIASIPGLRPHDFIIPNYPSYDDMYEQPVGLWWGFGRWVNGGHWSTCEARMMMAYSRLGKHEDARRSMKQLMSFVRRFRMDNPLTEFGSKVYQPKEPINLCYDTFGPAMGLVRGLFEYLYRADGLTIVPHIPPGIRELQQHFPIRYGKKRVYLSTVGTGPVTGVRVNRKPWTRFDKASVFLPYDETPDAATIQVVLGDAKAQTAPGRPAPATVNVPPAGNPFWNIAYVDGKRIAATAAKKTAPAASFAKAGMFYAALRGAGIDQTYEGQHAKLVFDCVVAVHAREKLKMEGKLPALPEVSQVAADRSYVEAAVRLTEGLRVVLESYGRSEDPRKKEMFTLWESCASAP